MWKYLFVPDEVTYRGFKVVLDLLRAIQINRSFWSSHTLVFCINYVRNLFWFVKS